MKMIICLLIIITAKILLTKCCSIAIILLSFVLKGKNLHKDERKWNDYFLSLSKSFAIKYAICIYLAATILSSAAYVLFQIFEFEYPLFFTLILTVTCAVLTLCKYLLKGRNGIVDAIGKIQQSAMTEEDNN